MRTERVSGAGCAPADQAGEVPPGLRVRARPLMGVTMTARSRWGRVRATRPQPNLCPTSARPRANARMGLPNLPNLFAYTRKEPAFNTLPIYANRLGRLGRLGGAKQGGGFILPNLCPTSIEVGQGTPCSIRPVQVGAGVRHGSSPGRVIAGCMARNFGRVTAPELWFRGVPAGVAA